MLIVISIDWANHRRVLAGLAGPEGERHQKVGFPARPQGALAAEQHQEWLGGLVYPEIPPKGLTKTTLQLAA